MKQSLQSSSIKKFVFDVRNLADALLHSYGISLKNILDVQLLELAVRPAGSRVYVSGVAKAVEDSGILTTEQLATFKDARKTFASTFVPQRGGNEALLLVRPMDEIMQSYCALDVYFLPPVYDSFRKQLDPEPRPWLDRIRKETNRRLTKVNSTAYEGQGFKLKFAPFGWKTL